MLPNSALTWRSCFLKEIKFKRNIFNLRTDLAALRAGRVVRRHIALERISRVEVGRVADGAVWEVGRRCRGQDSRGRELQGRVWRGAPRRYNCHGNRQRSHEGGND